MSSAKSSSGVISMEDFILAMMISTTGDTAENWMMAEIKVD